MSLVIAHTPSMKFVYKDELRPLLEIGEAQVCRASHVEPCGTQWTADLSPVGGPLLGPFDLRQDALDAEVAWLAAHLGEI